MGEQEEVGGEGYSLDVGARMCSKVDTSVRKRSCLVWYVKLLLVSDARHSLPSIIIVWCDIIISDLIMVRWDIGLLITDLIMVRWDILITDLIMVRWTILITDLIMVIYLTVRSTPGRVYLPIGLCGTNDYKKTTLFNVKIVSICLQRPGWLECL